MARLRRRDATVTIYNCRNFGGLSALQYYVPTIAVLSVLGSCYGQLAVALAARRQAGILKRIRATPLPAWAYFAGLLAHCVLMSVIDIALIVAVGRLYGVPFPSHWLAIMLTLVLGAASFCALGVAVASVISNAEAAPAVAQLVLFPLMFISGTCLPIHSALLNRVSGWLPVRPFNEALTGPFASMRGLTGGNWRCSRPGARSARSWRFAAFAGIHGPNRRRGAGRPARSTGTQDPERYEQLDAGAAWYGGSGPAH